MPKNKIEFFDDSSEVDMQRAELILSTKNVIMKETVMFPYTKLVWEE